MRRILRAAALAAVALGVALAAGGLASAARADVDDFHFASMDADYTLTRADDGTSELRVVETFVAVFPDTDQNRGMRRLLLESSFGAPIDPELVSVTDGEGDPRPVETDSEDGVLAVTVRADDFVHGEQTYVFTYTLRNVTPHFADTDSDEFYWDVNGVDWSQPFGRVSARLHVDAELAAALTGGRACYVGEQDATTTCPIAAETAPDGSVTVSAEATDVAPFQTLTVAVGFATGTFTQFDASYFASPWGWLQALAAVGMLAALAWAVVVRVRLLSDAPGRPAIIAEYTPPSVIDALESAVLLGHTTKAIPAEVLEQAVVGSLRIVEGSRGWWGRVSLEAHLIDRSRADRDGRMLLDGLFGADAAPGAVFVFGRQDTRLSTAARSILSAAGSELVQRGLRRSVPLRRRIGPVLLSFAAGAGMFGFGVAALTASVTPWVPLLLLILAVPLLFVVGGLIARKPLTALGAETRDHLTGLKEFIEWAEADRIRMLQSPVGAERAAIDPADPRQMLRLYEALLPYAVVFGQEKDWAERLAVLYDATGTPGWYLGTSSFSASAFASGIGSLSAGVSSASSTSGGSSGGGSAGGGGGGGGGGGV
ncbi:DUF2207 family protein [Microbacterium sp. RD1]|uniref:DUF2207 family protein n=1 Tax=Microbacterium sp. RD1 TaxID=3457313 RepID=UPI003FA60B94